ncbi:MAG: acetylglutamate kinase [Defluviitaleaceae bacterium]|nr:acetylglutamate kinase [Defluviitaleaceae bacterium]MCL2836162.1 acetylglutamate kinase [Defluviitaleaceae bacterium]
MGSISNEVKTQVLTQALPYIQRYTGKVIVVNYGGSADGKRENIDALMSDLVLLDTINVKVVLVHEECGDVAGMLELSAAINKAGGKALALCGADKETVEGALGLGYIPVVAAIDYDNGKALKGSADNTAARIAGELKAENMIAITNVRGVLKDPSDDSTLISELSISDVPYLTKQGVITGGMTEKVASCVEAIRRGVKKAFIIDGNIAHAILIELFSDEGIGTMII